MATGINLLPWRSSLRLEKERYFRGQILVIFGFVVILLAVWHLVLWRQTNTVIKQTAYARQQLSLLQRQSQDKDDVKQGQQKLELVAGRIIILEKRRLGLIQIFENLHRGMTANLQLTQLVIKGDSVKLFGKTDSMFGITQLIKSFSQTKYCAMPLVQRISRQGDEYNFVVLLSCGS
ncbi:conserved hypothetical protein [Gammaproteobacteria bacterium]